jgi:AraC-like DNA-binding protein
MTKVIGLMSPVIVPLIIAGILFFSSEKNNRPRLFLAYYMLLIAFIFIANAFYFEHNYRIYAKVHSLHIGAVLAVYPGVYCYIRMLVNPRESVMKNILHFIPSILFFILSAFIFFVFLSSSEQTLFLSEYRFNPDFSMRWLKILYFVRIGNIAVLFVQVFLYLFLIYRLLSRHRDKMADIFSDPEKFQLNWLRILNISLALSAFITVFLYTVNPVRLFGDDRYLAYPMLLIALILWFLGIMGNNQPQLPIAIFNENDREGDKFVKPSSDLAKRLTEYFETKKPYLNPDLKIWDVASELGTNRTYISQTINSNFNQNFSSFVSSYRVEEAKRIIAKNQDKSLLMICEEVGFGSVSSLSRAFSNHTKKSISHFRNQSLKQ